MSSFAGKSVIVTGGAGGLGKAIATSFVEAGAHVVICDVNEATLQQTRSELEQKGSVQSIRADVTDPAQVAAAINLAQSKTGRLDILINNAGIMDHIEPVGQASLELWNRVIQINLTGTFIFSDLAVKAMLKQQPNGGAIVNVASAAAFRGATAGAAYTASKHGVIGLTKNTAAFLGKKGIRCNAIMPGPMETSIGHSLMTAANQENFGIINTTMAMQPSFSDLSQVAVLVQSLCQDGGVINGACVPADHGWAAY